MKINWKRYLDQIYSITQAKNIEKNKELQEELDRVGILKSGIYTRMIDVNSPFYKIIYDSLNKINDTSCYNGGFKMTMNSYFAIKQAYEQGYNKIMIVEDDVRFLNSLKKINELMKYIIKLMDKLKQYDIIVCNAENVMYSNHYDFNENYINEIKNVSINDQLYVTYYSCATCVIYNRNAMEQLINFYEHNYTCIDRYNDLILHMPSLKIGAIYPWLAVQDRHFIELYNIPQIIDNYNKININDEAILNFLFNFFKPCQITDDGIPIFYFPVEGRKKYAQNILNSVKDKTTDKYKLCQKYIEIFKNFDPKH